MYPKTLSKHNPLLHHLQTKFIKSKQPAASLDMARSFTASTLTEIYHYKAQLRRGDPADEGDFS
jgi:hypothetical protein